MWEGRSSPSCTISSARSVSYARMPASASASLSPISCVAIDLTLTTSRLAGGPDQPGDDPVGLVGVRGPVHLAARRRDRRLQLLQIVVEMAQRTVLDRGARGAQLRPSRPAPPRPWPACRGWCAWRGAGWRAAGCRGWRWRRPAGRPACPGRCRSPRRSPSVLARISAMWTGRTAEPWPGERAADVHQTGVVDRADRLGAGPDDVADLVGAHRRRDGRRSSPRRCRRSRSTPRRPAAPAAPAP